MRALRKVITAATTDEDAAAGSTSTTSRLHAFPTTVLNDILGRHFRATRETSLSVSGSYLPFLYCLIATLVLPPHNKAVVIIDMNGAFSCVNLAGCYPFSQPDSGTLGDPTVADHLPSAIPRPTARVGSPDLDHVHVYQPAWDASVIDVMAEAEKFMLYGNHASRGREWWGTVVISEGPTFFDNATASSSPGALLSRPVVIAGYKGWLRIEKEPVSPPLNLDAPYEKLPAEITRYDVAVSQAGWLATSDWGGFVFRLWPRPECE